MDIPEVSLVAILDADKEGFLRSERSLIQTIGRAARNTEGRNPSLNKLIPTKTSNSPIRKSRIISILSSALVSECMYLTRNPAFITIKKDSYVPNVP